LPKTLPNQGLERRIARELSSKTSGLQHDMTTHLMARSKVALTALTAVFAALLSAPAFTQTFPITPAQKAIAQYWNDEPGTTFTPPGHSISIARQVLAKEKANLSRAAETFAKVGMGVHDAMVFCWNAKYKHNQLRPVSYINQVIDSKWKPLLTTPVYPDYPSEHAAQSAATAQILADLFGSNYSFTDNSHKDRTDIDGSPRTFKNFLEFANEAATSRLYGGIHYRMGNEQGILQGIQIGKNIGKLKFKK
jgi:hypothetical protein